jgi:2-polyprenyl-6-methoxyphenol hydroxylase-like FAD-dependent oxidoreductase
MKILIVGAGIAGLTLSALLMRRGIYPRVIERADRLDHTGYMIGLYPLGSNVLHGLGCYEKFIKQTAPIQRYKAYNEKGRLFKEFSFEVFNRNYGSYQDVERGQLIQILMESCEGLPIEFSTTVQTLVQTKNEVVVTLSNGDEEAFDLVVGADGIHSKTRDLLFDGKKTDVFETGWGGWVWWGAEKTPSNQVEEFWVPDAFLGMYPVKNRCGMIAAVPFSSSEAALKGKSRREFILNQFPILAEKRPELFASLPSDDEPLFFWPLSDVRCSQWAKGRVVLLGDAAVAFLPTAGVGASMAMESAAVLNDILSRADASHIPLALSHFVKRRQKRVVAAQQSSRSLANYMFVKGAFQSMMRNCLVRIIPASAFLESIIKDLDQPL